MRREPKEFIITNAQGYWTKSFGRDEAEAIRLAGDDFNICIQGAFGSDVSDRLLEIHNTELAVLYTQEIAGKDAVPE